MSCLRAITPGCCCGAWKSASMATSRRSRRRTGRYLRKHFFGKYPELLELVKD